jgi:hypothetical protein
MSSDKDVTPPGARNDAAPFDGAERAPAATKGNDTVDTLLEALGASDKPFMPRHKAESNGDVAAAYAAGPRTIAPGQKTRAPEAAVIVAHTVERVIPAGMPLNAADVTEPGHRAAMARAKDTQPIRRQADTVPALHVQARQDALTNRRLVLAAVALCALVLVIGLARFAMRTRAGDGAPEATAGGDTTHVPGSLPAKTPPHDPAAAAHPAHAGPAHAATEADPASREAVAGAAKGATQGASPLPGNPPAPSNTMPKATTPTAAPVVATATATPAAANAPPQRPAERVRSGLERGGNDRPYEAPKAPQLPQTRVDLLEDDIRKDDIRK